MFKKYSSYEEKALSLIKDDLSTEFEKRDKKKKQLLSMVGDENDSIPKSIPTPESPAQSSLTQKPRKEAVKQPVY